MNIRINYDSCWRNSFLAGSNNEPLPKKGRKFVASIKELNSKKQNNYHSQEITHDTVMGILNRLIGDQRKLYQSRQDKNYYFAELEQYKDKYIHFDDDPKITNEMTYLRNISGSTDQNSFTGMIKTNHPIFTSDYSKQFWGVLALTFDQLVDFIINDTVVNEQMEQNLDPLTIIAQFATIKKAKAVAYAGKEKQATEILEGKFQDEFKPLDDGKLKQLPMYCAALYLQLERLATKFDMAAAKSKAGKITGISKNNCTAKDFMANYTTGRKKPIYGNPYIQTKYIKGVGKVESTLQKASGVLEITLNISPEKAQELKQMIANAGVSAFPLGKKGLAYVSRIR
jgi:hypothetical protein